MFGTEQELVTCSFPFCWSLQHSLSWVSSSWFYRGRWGRCSQKWGILNQPDSPNKTKNVDLSPCLTHIFPQFPASVHSNEPLNDWLLESSSENKVLESKKKSSNNKSNPWHVPCFVHLTPAGNMALLVAYPVHHNPPTMLSWECPEHSYHNLINSCQPPHLLWILAASPKVGALKSLNPFSVFQNETTFSLLKNPGY